jgi:hypothetical protein
MELGIALAVIIGAGVGLLLAVNRKPNTREKINSRNQLNKKVVQEKWEGIEKTFALGGESNYKSAILESDKLVDYVLKAMVSGENMGDRLKKAKSKFKNYSVYDNLWFAHKVRNNIAHEVDHEIHSAEAKRAIEYYRKALKELGAL